MTHHNTVKVTAVRLYPSGGIICQRVWPYEIMNVRKALHQLDSGQPACVGIPHVYALRCVREDGRVQPVVVGEVTQ